MNDAPLRKVPVRKTLGRTVDRDSVATQVSEDNSIEVWTGEGGERYVVMLDHRCDEGGVWVESEPAEVYQVIWHEMHDWDKAGDFELRRLDDADRATVLARLGWPNL